MDNVITNIGEFERQVRKWINKAQFRKYQQALAAVPGELRERFVATLQHGFGIPAAFHHLYKGQNLPDKFYHRYLKYAVDNALTTAKGKPAGVSRRPYFGLAGYQLWHRQAELFSVGF